MSWHEEFNKIFAANSTVLEAIQKEKEEEQKDD